MNPKPACHQPNKLGGKPEQPPPVAPNRDLPQPTGWFSTDCHQDSQHSGDSLYST